MNVSPCLTDPGVTGSFGVTIVIVVVIVTRRLRSFSLRHRRGGTTAVDVRLN